MNKEEIISTTNPAQPLVEEEETQDLSECFLDWVKIFALVLFTFSLIAAVFVACWGISIPNYITGTSIYLLIFVIYVCMLSAAWYFGLKQRDAIRRRAIRLQLELEKKALQ